MFREASADRRTVVGSLLLAIAVAGEGALLKYFTETGNQSYAKGGIFFLYFFALVGSLPRVFICCICFATNKSSVMAHL